jgi:hypothetical protein
VSDILSPQYHYLDAECNPSSATGKGIGQWQDLEAILYEWQHTLDCKGAYFFDDVRCSCLILPDEVDVGLVCVRMNARAVDSPIPLLPPTGS